MWMGHVYSALGTVLYWSLRNDQNTTQCSECFHLAWSLSNAYCTIIHGDNLQYRAQGGKALVVYTRELAVIVSSRLVSSPISSRVLPVFFWHITSPYRTSSPVKLFRKSKDPTYLLYWRVEYLIEKRGYRQTVESISCPNWPSSSRCARELPRAVKAITILRRCCFL